MPTITLDIVYNTDKELVMSSSDLQALYLYGLPAKVNMSDEALTQLIQSAQAEIEKYLGIKFSRQIIDESFDFYVDNFRQFSYIPATYPVVQAFDLTGYLGQVKQLQYPSVWLTTRRTNDKETFYRSIFIVPAQAAVVQVGGGSMVYSGVMPAVGMQGFNTIPNYWNAVYCTGFEKIPQDLLGLVGKLAAVGVLNQLSNKVLGMAGITSQSLSIDGLSQSVSASNPYREQIKGYLQDIDNTLKRLYVYYKGFQMTSM